MICAFIVGHLQERKKSVKKTIFQAVLVFPSTVDYTDVFIFIVTSEGNV